MKRLLLTMIAILTASICFSQEQNKSWKFPAPDKGSWNRKFILPDSSGNHLYLQEQKIPNAIKKPLPLPKPAGNNGRGHDIYILPIDNMPSIRPDSTYHSNMFTGRRD